MIIKYRIHELAKDLGIQSRDILDFFAQQNVEMEKKHMTVLSDQQLNMFFDYLTQTNQVKSLDDYFEKTGKVTKNEKVVKVVAKKEDVNIVDADKSKAPKKSASSDVKNEMKKIEPQRKVAKKDNMGIVDIEKPNKSEIVAPKQEKTIKKEKQKLMEQKTKSVEPPETRTVRVDTGAADVNLEKYNEKYEKLAQSKGAAEETGGRKKRANPNQRSNQRRRQLNRKKEDEKSKQDQIILERARQLKHPVLVPDTISVGELASRMKIAVSSIIKKLMSLGQMAGINDVLDFDTASVLVMEMDMEVEREIVETLEEKLFKLDEDKEKELATRSPVVVVMGHVDHGKTSLLDAIRNAKVTDTEAGGITQHIGAYKVPVGDGNITFLDTPGHAAFTSMRARGTQVTDIAILVVAADDGIMPQTVEAINHAKAADIPMVIAVNKIDKPDANVEMVKQKLTEHGLVPEEWGGDVIVVPISAKTGEGIDNLLENVLLVAEVMELKANPNRLAQGTVIEAELDKGKGPIATLLVQNGTIRRGDVIIAGTAVGRVRAMTNDRGRSIKEAGPSTPVEITGLSVTPSAGDLFNIVENEKLARELAVQRKTEAKELEFKSYRKVTLDNLFSQIEEGELKELTAIVKADVQGSAEAVKQSLEKLSNDEVRVRVIHSGVGAINESDVMLADASNAIIIGFNVRPESNAESNANAVGVDMHMYRVIYDAIDDVKAAMIGLLDSKFRDVTIGKVEVRDTYTVSKIGTIAGCYVLSGEVRRNSKVRVVREGIVVAEDEIASLKRFQDDVKEVKTGYECGITLEKFNDIKMGDIFEAYIIEEYRETVIG